MKRVIYLPSGYKARTNRVVAGRAASGEISPKGLVAHTEDWEGRIAADAAPSQMHYGYSVSTGEIRPLTLAEQIERGYYIPGKGPRGVRPL